MFAFEFHFTSQYFAGSVILRAASQKEAVKDFKEMWNTKLRPVPSFWIKSKSTILGGETSNRW